MSDFLQGLGFSAGVFLGIVAGTAVTLLVSYCQQRLRDRRQVRNLDFELRMNIKKIDGWLEELDRYRNAVNGDSLHDWFGYFDLRNSVSPTANAMFVSGLMYNTLSHEQIEPLQAVLQELSPVGEETMNGQLRASREEFNRLRVQRNPALWHSITKPEAVRRVNFGKTG